MKRKAKEPIIGDAVMFKELWKSLESLHAYLAGAGDTDQDTPEMETVECNRAWKRRKRKTEIWLTDVMGDRHVAILLLNLVYRLDPENTLFFYFDATDGLWFPEFHVRDGLRDRDFYKASGCLFDKGIISTRIFWEINRDTKVRFDVPCLQFNWEIAQQWVLDGKVTKVDAVRDAVV